MGIIFLDIKKAFDSVKMKILRRKLRKLGISTQNICSNQLDLLVYAASNLAGRCKKVVREKSSSQPPTKPSF